MLEILSLLAVVGDTLHSTGMPQNIYNRAVGCSRTMLVGKTASLPATRVVKYSDSDFSPDMILKAAVEREHVEAHYDVVIVNVLAILLFE